MLRTEVIHDPFPMRFRTYQDAMLFMTCLHSGKEFPADKKVPVFELVDGKSVMRQEYKDAPYELGFYAKTR